MTFAEIKCEQSRLVFNGPVSWLHNWQGFNFQRGYIIADNIDRQANMLLDIIYYAG